MNEPQEIPTQFVLAELEARLQAKEHDLIVAGARIRQLTEEIRVLQETNVRLQKQADLPQPA